MNWMDAQVRWLEALEAEGRSPHTLAGYRGHLAHLNRWVAEQNIIEVEEFGPFHLRRFLTEYAQNHSPHTVNGTYRNLRSWLRWMVREYGLKNIATDKVKTPKVAETSKKVYTTGELSALRKHLEKAKTPLALRDNALVSLLMDTGARASEMLATTLDDLQDSCILLRQTKGKRPRVVPLGSRAEKALWQYIQRGRPRLKPKDKLIFVDRYGNALTRNGLRHILTRLGEALGFPVSAHRFRHTWATMMLRKGVDLESLRRMGGWANYEMLKTYSHLSIEDLKRTQERHSLLDGL